jgi:hypothetical protein
MVSSSSTYNVTAAGLYTLNESNHCGVNRDSVLVGFIDPPITFNLGPDTTLCPGESILLTVPYSGFTVKWQDGSTGNTLLADKAQTYSLELSNKCGIKSDALTIAFDNNIPVVCPGTNPNFVSG